MKIRELELLHSMVELGSVSAAARAMHTTQPNASKILKGLEERLGFLLFERVSGRLQITQEGRLIAEQAELTLMSLRRFESRARNVRDMRLGSLTIGAMPLLSRSWLPGLLAEFMVRYPEVSTSLHTRSSRKLIELVSERQLDLALGMLAIDEPAVECQKLLDLEMLAALHLSHPLAAKTELEPSDFHQQDFIASSMLDRSREQAESYFRKHNVVPRERSECSLPGVALQLVERNIGVALVDRLTVTEYAGGKAVFRPIKPAINVTIWLMRPRLRPRSRLVKAFEQLVLSHATSGSVPTFASASGSYLWQMLES